MTTVQRKAGAKKPAPRKKPRAKRAPGQGPKWDISGIDTWGANRHELGATIPEAGNSAYYETGGWRTMVPVIDSERSDGCMLCYFYCPDAAIVIEDGKAVGVDLAHCKGCGICAKECPPGAIVMNVEEKE